MSGKSKKPFGPMYQKAMRQYAAQRGIKKGAMAVLRVLLDYCNGESGQSRPGRAIIKDETGLSDRTLDTALKTLRDREVIMPLAYLTGGRARTTCYAFALPAWSGQPGTETPEKTAVESEGQNPRNFCAKPPQKFPETPAKIAVPTEGTERTEGGTACGDAEKASARRGQDVRVPDPDRGGRLSTFDELVRVAGRSYGEARTIWDRGTAAIAAE